MKKAIITGANGQLGNAFVEGLVKKGYFVYAVDLNIENIKDSDNIKPIRLDITDETKVHDFFSSIQNLDVLINNAGIGVFTPFEDRTATEFKKVMEVNLLGAFLMSQSSIKIMKNSSGGKIVNIASIYGSTSSDERIYGDSGRNNSEVYSATKAGLISMTQYMATHFGKFNIQTNSISPGGIYNQQSADFVKNYEYKTPMHRMGKVQDLLSTLLYLISEDTAYTNGQDIAVDGGFLAW
ncbi:SDR family oxidoreductase [Patescibacteria group bacterium]|nr:SDR family oxidoreductase [Patescibacteria group bacterium]